MKVNETTRAASSIDSSPAVVPAQAANERVAGTDMGAAAARSPDRVTTEDADRLRESLANAKHMAAGARAARVQQLAQQVRAGTYRPSVSQLAEEILAQADLEAKLAQSIG